MGFDSISKELVKEDKVRILESLMDKPCSFREILNINGYAPSTLSRTLTIFEDEGLVRREGEKYCLTGAGLAFLKVIDVIKAVYEFKDDINGVPEFVELLPPGFLAGIHNLRRAEVMDIESALKLGVERIAEAKEYGLYVDKVISYDVYKLMVEKNLQGVEERVISNRETLYGRGSTFRKVLQDMDLTKDEYELVKRKVHVKVFDTPIQLGVIDGEFAILQLNDRVDRFYVSEDKRFITWCEYLFTYLLGQCRGCPVQ
ncbi:ArsR family transcriptional regulator [Geoglobus acetivorans]|uniref:ArsR family transcriptional regulator n=1 Tax=Geoglobus acetivorans TaxID=565033 RepID=A0ABZ3H416_GEOAI|nr:ArsR family transcriptional regulator [Geoglobus acetivorans]